MYASEIYVNNILKEEQKIIKKVSTKNYNVDDYKNPQNDKVEKYRKKEVIGKDGKKHVLTFAIMKDRGPNGGKTKLTSKWDHK